MDQDPQRTGPDEPSVAPGQRPPLWLVLLGAPAAGLLTAGLWVLSFGYVPFPLDILLLVFLPGLAPGVAMRHAGRALRPPRAGVVASVTAVAGCLLGDFLSIRLSNPGVSMVELLSDQLGPLLTTMFGIDKLLLYVAAGYLAWQIARWSRARP